MNPAKELFSSLVVSPASQGTVVGVIGDMLRVQTSVGVVTMERGIGSYITNGDSVKVVNNVVVGRLQREELLPIYYL
jgi:hypothetical protein